MHSNTGIFVSDFVVVFIAISTQFLDHFHMNTCICCKEKPAVVVTYVVPSAGSHYVFICIFEVFYALDLNLTTAFSRQGLTAFRNTYEYV